ncbi:MAG: hypothetical protein SF029_12750 [bacterium]|nr:hypothetical protein [bacterium]
MDEQNDLKTQENTGETTPDHETAAPPVLNTPRLSDDMADDLRSTGTTPAVDFGGLEFGEVVIYGTPDEPLDIDAALASVSELDREIAQRAAQEAAERARLEAEARAAEEAARWRANYNFPRPPLITMARGQLASVIPALVLIALGAFLTFLLASGATLNTGLVGVLGTGVMAVLLLSHWLSSGRWARGAAFVGFGLLLSLGMIGGLSQAPEIGADGWPLLIVAWGMALLLAAFLAQPTHARAAFVGLALIVGGVVTLALTLNLLNVDLTGTVETFWPVVAVIAGILLLLPLVARRRR